jgi:hypothetical protein
MIVLGAEDGGQLRLPGLGQIDTIAVGGTDEVRAEQREQRVLRAVSRVHIGLSPLRCRGLRRYRGRTTNFSCAVRRRCPAGEYRGRTTNLSRTVKRRYLGSGGPEPDHFDQSIHGQQRGMPLEAHAVSDDSSGSDDEYLSARYRGLCSIPRGCQQQVLECSLLLPPIRAKVSDIRR